MSNNYRKSRTEGFVERIEGDNSLNPSSDIRSADPDLLYQIAQDNKTATEIASIMLDIPVSHFYTCIQGLYGQEYALICSQAKMEILYVGFPNVIALISDKVSYMNSPDYRWMFPKVRIEEIIAAWNFDTSGIFIPTYMNDDDINHTNDSSLDQRTIDE